MKKGYKNIIWYIIGVLVVAFVLCFNIQKSRENQNTGKPNLYAVVPLTGGFSSIGKSVKQAIDFW